MPKSFHDIFALLLFLSALACPVLASNSSTAFAQENQEMQANLENIELKDFIKFIASYTGRNIVFQEDKIPSAKVTIFSTQSMTEPELMAVFSQVLNSANLYTVSRGNVLYILNKRDAQEMEPSLDGARKKAQELVTTVYRLGEDTAPNDAVNLLKQFSSQFGSVQAIPQARAVLIRDRSDRINKMLALLSNVKRVKPSWAMEIVPLDQARAESAASKLNDIYTSLKKRGQIGETPMITPVEWANSLLVSGTEKQIAMVQSLLQQIDEVSEKSVERELKVYRLLNAKAGSAASVLKALVISKTTGGSEQGQSAAAGPSQGELLVSADSSTNSLLVLADPSFQPTVDEVIKQLDRPLDQVYIEALIMETSLTNSQNFGVEWISGGGSGDKYTGSIGYLEDDSPLMSYADPVINNNGAPNLGALPGGFSLGVLGNMVKYKGEYFPTIGALISYTKGVDDFNLLSAPQIMTLDNSEAEIFVGDQMPFQTGQQTTQGGSTQTAYDYRDVGIKLTVTPYVNSRSGLIRLDIHQEYNQPSSGKLGLPITRNRVTKTSVQLIDGSTMVISGLIENTQSRNQDAVPGLSQLPVLGWLFKKRGGSASKKTLMVFISARIVRTQEQAEALSRGKMERLKKERRKMEQTIKQEFGVVEDKPEQAPAKPQPTAPQEQPEPQVREF
jgi:general secretion pathway protein D